jgi:hypothetical protein
VLVAYSNNARGYTMVCLFTLLIVGLGAFLRLNRNIAGWALLGSFSALGMYTVPIMLYPVGIVFTWLLLSWWFGDTGVERRGRWFLIALIGAACAGALMTGILYLPVLFASGWESLAGNNMVAALPWDSFLGNLFSRLGRTWGEWTADLGLVGRILLTAGLVLSLAFHRRLTNQRFPLPLAALIWMAAVLLLQRVAPERRIWIWLLPPALLYSAAGLVFFVRLVSPRKQPGRDARFALLGIAVVSALAVGGAYADYREFLADPLGDVEAVTLVLADSLGPGQVVVVPPDLGPPFWYYFARHGLSDSYLFRIKHLPFAFALLVVDAASGQTAVEAARASGNFGDVLDLGRAELAFTRGSLAVYQVPHR